MLMIVRPTADVLFKRLADGKRTHRSSRPVLSLHASIKTSLTAFVTALVTVSVLACSPGAISGPPGRVILIGIDGATPEIVELLISQGKLPNLAKIAKEGVGGPLRSAIPIFSPRIWNTIATGMTPEKHGILTFSYAGRDGRHHLFSSTHRKARALWSIASDAGLKVGVVNFWNTYPLEKVNGVMVSDHILAKEIEGRNEMIGTKESEVGDVVYPAEWNARLSGLIQKSPTPLPDYPSPFAEGNDLPRWVLRDELHRRFVDDGALAHITGEVLRAETPDVAMVLLTGIDRISHYLWSVMEPPGDYSPNLVPTEQGRAGGLKALHAYYEYTDALIGELIADYGPNDMVMVVSDHGFEALEAMMRLTGGHKTEKAINGVIYARAPGIAPGSVPRNVSVNDITPTILAWLGLPIAFDMDGSKASFLDNGEIEMIDSYSSIEIEFVNADEVPSGVEADIVEQLKSLGYIDAE